MHLQCLGLLVKHATQAVLEVLLGGWSSLYLSTQTVEPARGERLNGPGSTAERLGYLGLRPPAPVAGNDHHALSVGQSSDRVQQLGIASVNCVAFAGEKR